MRSDSGSFWPGACKDPTDSSFILHLLHTLSHHRPWGETHFHVCWVKPTQRSAHKSLKDSFGEHLGSCGFLEWISALPLSYPLEWAGQHVSWVLRKHANWTGEHSCGNTGLYLVGQKHRDSDLWYSRGTWKGALETGPSTCWIRGRLSPGRQCQQWLGIREVLTSKWIMGLVLGRNGVSGVICVGRLP